LLNQLKDSSCDLEGERPLSAFTLKRDWDCRVTQGKVQVFNNATLQWNGKFNNDAPTSYEEEFKIYRMLIDGYQDQSRVKETGLPLLESSKMKEGMSVADIGSGPGLFTFKFSDVVGKNGKVYAIDINASVLKYIQFHQKKKAITNIETRLVAKDSIGLPKNSVDVALLIQTYHALSDFENPFGPYYKTVIHPWLQTIRSAIKPNGILVIQDHSPSLSVLQKHLIDAGFTHQKSYIEYDHATEKEAVWVIPNSRSEFKKNKMVFTWAEAELGTKTQSPRENYISVYTVEK
jgi:ubiquinone/menaquinone biosynthesis C-methylase UbiE